jgi:S-adenosylmethionine hydrolase
MEQLVLPPVEPHASGFTGQVIYIDHFGNATTNITETILRPFPKDTLLVSIGDAVQIRGVETSYATVAVGAPVMLMNSWGRLEIAIRNGSAAQRFGILPGQHISLALG